MRTGELVEAPNLDDPSGLEPMEEQGLSAEAIPSTEEIRRA